MAVLAQVACRCERDACDRRDQYPAGLVCKSHRDPLTSQSFCDQKKFMAACACWSPVIGATLVFRWLAIWSASAMTWSALTVLMACRLRALVGVGAAGALEHFLRQPGQVRVIRPGLRGACQDLIGVTTGAGREPVGPGTQVFRPRRGEFPGGERFADHRVVVQAPHPPDRTRGGAFDDPGLPPQPH